MIARIQLAVWLVIVWVVLWQHLSVANVISGVVVAVVLLLVFPYDAQVRVGAFRPLAAMRFVAVFAWKLVQASAVVAWEVVTPTSRITEGIVAVPLQGVSDIVVATVANSITLTPGTITVEVDRDPTVLYIHVLHLRDIEAVRREVQHLEWLAVRAFAASEALEEFNQDVDPQHDREKT